MQYQEADVVSEDTINRHERYVKNGRPDQRHIDLWVTYNEKLIEYANGLKIADDPYLSRMFLIILNEKQGKVNSQHAKLTLERINQNVQDYIARKLREKENPMAKQLERNATIKLEDNSENIL